MVSKADLLRKYPGYSPNSWSVITFQPYRKRGIGKYFYYCCPSEIVACRTKNQAYFNLVDSPKTFKGGSFALLA